MKPSINIWILLAIGLLFVRCGADKQEAKSTTPAPIYSLVFLDKTQSVNVNKAYVAEKYRQALTEIVENNLQNKGDKLDVYFIHENTSKARALSLTIRSEMDNLDGTNATDRESIETAFQLSLQKEKSIYLRQILLKLNQQNTGVSNQFTDILASIPLIAKANETGSDIKVYFFSDMIESMKGTGRRDFHTAPPVSDDQAAEQAKVDVKTWETFIIGSPQVTIISPFEPTASTKEHNPHVAFYWQTLFQELGGVRVEEQ